MLELSKIKAGLADWNLSVLQIPEIIELAIDSVKPLCIKKNISIKYRLPKNSPLVFADKDRLIQVLTNLLSNALKFTEKRGKISIAQEILKGKRSKDKTDFVKIEIRDWGRGISKENLKNIYKQFQQIGEVLTDKPQRTGLCLALSKEIIRHIGGNIWVKSELDKGSTFYIAIPVLSDDKR